MRRRIRAAVCAALTVLLAFGAAGCLLEQDIAPGYSTDTGELSVGSPIKHYFHDLSDTEKQAYNAVLTEAELFPPFIEIPALTQDELNHMFTALLYDNPELFFLENTSTIRKSQSRTLFYPDYRMREEDYTAMIGKCREVADQILDEAMQEETAFARERVVHDRVIAMCTYTDNKSNPYRNTIYGVLTGGAASCEGYAKTAKYLLDQLDIPCYVICGTSTPPGSNSQDHMWNIVQLDGDAYHLDLTWDDPILEGGGELIQYSYFNVTDEQICLTHADYDAGCECTATAENFFVHEDLQFASFGESEQTRAAAYAAELLSMGSDGFQLQFADSASYSDACRLLFDDQQIYSLLKQIKESTDRSFATDRVSYFNYEENNIVEIIVV